MSTWFLEENSTSIWTASAKSERCTSHANQLTQTLAGFLSRGVRFHIVVKDMSIWAKSLSELLASGQHLGCDARLNAPRRQLPRSVSQRDDVHWKHIGFPVALHLSPVYGHSYPRWHGSVVTFVCVEHHNSNMTKPSVASRSQRGPSHLAMGNLVGSVKIRGKDRR